MASAANTIRNGSSGARLSVSPTMTTVASRAVTGIWGPAVRVLRDHPATRSMLHRGLFWNVWLYLMWRPLLALLAPAWLWRLVLARHLTQVRRRAAERGAGAAAVPFRLLYDAVECTAVAGGALRNRVWVL
jgi:hypothetical protein